MFTADSPTGDDVGGGGGGDANVASRSGSTCVRETASATACALRTFNGWSRPTRVGALLVRAAFDVNQQFCRVGQ